MNPGPSRISLLLLCALAAGSFAALLIAFGVFGGLALPMYSLCIAHTNDHLEPEQMVAASGALVLAAGFGIGGLLGARVAVIGGERVIRPILVVAVVVLAGRMLGLY